MTNKRLRSMVAGASVLVLTLGALTGCSVAVSENQTEQKKPVTTEEKVTEAVEETVDVIEKYGVKLENLDLDGTLHGQYAGQSITIPVASGDFEAAINAVVPIFEEYSGATVTVETVPSDQLTDKIQLDLNNTQRYDVILAPIANLHSYAAADKIEDLQGLIDQYASEGYDIDDFLPGLFQTYGYYQGKMVAIPYKPDAELLFYRKDLFEDTNNQAKYKEMYGTDLKVPETNDEMMQVAEFFTKSINPDSPVDYGYSNMMLKGSTRLLFYNRGGDDIDENLAPNMNNQEGVDALNYVLKLQEYAPKEWMQMGWDEANQFFANGNAAMMEQWPGLWLTCQADGSAVKDKIGVAITPGKTPVLGGWGAGVASTSQNKELAWKFVEFITSKDGELLKIENTMDPCRASSYEIPDVAAISDLYTPLMETFNYAKTLADVDVPYLTSQLCDILEENIQGAMSGTTSVEDALSNADAQFTEAISANEAK